MKKISRKQKKLKKTKAKSSVKKSKEVSLKKLKKNQVKSCAEGSENNLQNSDTKCELETDVNTLENSCDMNEPENLVDVSESKEKEQNTFETSPKMKKKLKSKSEQRSEASQNISEFNLTEVGKERVKLDELIKTSQKISGQVLVKKQLQNATKLKSLSVPLSKPQLEKIKRTIAYDKVCNEVSKWDTVVKSNRDAEQIIYPLKRLEFHLESLETASERFISKHPVEEAVSKVLQTSENVLDHNRTLTVAEEKALQAMSLEEAKLRHNELMRHRALISYKEAKARRQNKIKSKRYHRILKKEKLKNMLKEFEELQKTDQKAALEKFLEADKLRILERMTLKHRNTGKWAKQQKIRAKYNPDSRSNLKEDLAIGRQLREKIATDISIQPKTFADVNLEDKFFEDNAEEFLIEDTGFGSLSTEISTSVISNNFTKSITKEDNPEKTKFKENSHENAVSKPDVPKPVKKSTIEDAMDFTSEATCLNSMVPDDITFGDEDLDDKDEGKISINQAFADEEFIAEFQEEKKAADKSNRPEGLNLFLPGWGSWGGPGIKTSKRKRRRFFIKPLEPQPKKNTLGNVIINEEKDKKAAVHQVSHLPFPFTNVHQFESYIRQPVGHTWNPQSSFQNLTAPKVITKMGKIIQPIDPEDVLLKKTTSSQDLQPKRKKKGYKEVKAF